MHQLDPECNKKKLSCRFLIGVRFLVEQLLRDRKNIIKPKHSLLRSESKKKKWFLDWKISKRTLNIFIMIFKENFGIEKSLCLVFPIVLLLLFFLTRYTTVSRYRIGRVCR